MIPEPEGMQSTKLPPKRMWHGCCGRGFALVLRHKGDGCDAFASTYAVKRPGCCMRRRGVIVQLSGLHEVGTRVNMRASSKASCMSRLPSHRHDISSLCRSSTDSEPH